MRRGAAAAQACCAAALRRDSGAACSTSVAAAAPRTRASPPRARARHAEARHSSPARLRRCGGSRDVATHGAAERDAGAAERVAPPLEPAPTFEPLLLSPEVRAFARQLLLGAPLLLPKGSSPSRPLTRTQRATQPGPLQQTLRRSFTLAGVGLHSGQLEVLRVRPAFAGEGRYFVRVPPGTLPTGGEGVGGAAPPASADVDAALLRTLRRTLSAGVVSASAVSALPDEHPAAGAPREARIPASAASLPRGAAASAPLRTVLRRDGSDEAHCVSTVEHVLAALEACGVDNARLEALGSGEVPILDGSAAPWAEAVAAAGVALAPGRRGGAPRRRKALRLPHPLTVGDGDAFVSYVPGPVTRLSAGIDFSEQSAAIGRRWFTWCPASDVPFYAAVAPARTFTTAAAARAAQQAGLIRGGSLDCALVADGEQWLNAPLPGERTPLRLPGEPCRHKLLDLLGDVALAARPGHAGLPLGHVVAYRAGHALHARFVAALTEAAAQAGEAAWVAPPLRTDENATVAVAVAR